MGLFKRNKDLDRDGLRGTAVVQSRKRASEADTSELDTLVIRSAPHEIDLEVHVDGREPYRVRDTFKVPRKFWNIASGVELPVRVDPQHSARIMIDWDAFESAGGVEIVKALGDQYKRDAVREIIGKDPVQLEGARTTVEQWLSGVKGGQMTQGDFNGYVDEYVAQGLLSAEEGAAAKQRAAEPNPRPTPGTHPPVEGVDYDMWIAATTRMVREKIPASGMNAYCESCGFPAGRGEAISAIWYERVQADDVLRGWYLQDMASP